METKQKQIEVQVIDVDKMVADLNKQLKEQGQDKVVENRRKFALVEKEGRVAIFDKECIGTIWHEGKTHDFKLDLYEKFSEKADGSKSFSMFPCLTASFSIKEAKEYLTGETKTLEQFMDDRFDYNSRIVGNTYSMLRFINEG